MKKDNRLSNVMAFFLLSIFTAVIPLSVETAVPPEERAALIAFYTSAGGDNWNSNTGWKETPLEADGFGAVGSEGNWYGITVTGDHVTGIDLRNNLLKGFIPQEIGDLFYLEHLYLGSDTFILRNNLNAGIPGKLENLSDLKALDLSWNYNMEYNTEPIPKLVKLEYLNLSYIKLEDHIPPEFGNLRQLKQFYWSHANIKGLPPELGNLENLEELDLENNDISFLPPEITKLRGLIKLNMYDNFLGNLPPEIGFLRRLESLNVGNNRLSVLPGEIGDLVNLVSFDGSSNEWLESLPETFGNLVNLEHLNLRFSSLKSLPSSFGNLVNLKYLDLSWNRLPSWTGPILGNLVNLEYLDLIDNNFTSFPQGLGNLVNLKTLDISYTDNMTGPIPAELGNLTRLESLDIKSNDLLNGPIPPELGNLENLKSLELDHNHLDQGIPPELGNLTNLEYLDLADNALSGPIPPELGNIRALKHLSLYGNRLSGSIPDAIGNLVNLETLEMYDNQFSGKLPGGIGNLVKLERLDFYKNRLTGFPPEIQNLTGLKAIVCNDNKISQLPPAIGNLPNLERIILQNNLLTDIPPEIAKLPGLKRLDISDNRIESLSTGIGDLEPLRLLDLSGNRLDSLPSTLANLENLINLGLGRNRFTEFPPVLLDMTFLEELDLSRNAISGPIPRELGNFTNLYTLVLSGNRLTGPIPESFLNLTNLSASFSSWDDYYTDLAYNMLYTENEEIRRFLNEKDLDWEMTQTVPPMVLSTRPSYNSVVITWQPIFYNWDSGSYLVYYSTNPMGPWNFAGETGDKSERQLEVTGLQRGTAYYLTLKTRTGPHNGNSNELTSRFSEKVYTTTLSDTSPEDRPPFGEMDLPVEGGAPVSGSIPVSGWALDDKGVQRVVIYLLSGKNKARTYIGDAVFVEGARPDIQREYPGFPGNHKAGWGHMLLTNFLPNGGNGYYTLQAVAYDIPGQETILGTRTIQSDNAGAVNPFGAIDTPTPGGTASGVDYRNQGWVLTPMPAKIPEDGSTINVYVDGVLLGHPTYNIYRSDIHDLFPGLANSTGAMAYFDFDTTAYADGVHTVYWTAADDAGHSEGIGSRYFTIQNQEDKTKQTGKSSKEIETDIPGDFFQPLGVKKGWEEDTPTEVICPDENGIITIRARPLERLVIRPAGVSAYMIAGGETKPLPIGSTLDRESGVFYWHPGPGFMGEYVLVFVTRGDEGERALKYVRVVLRE